jgi:hypothetical protein
MKIEIKSIYRSLLFEGDFSSVAEAVKAALASRANLSGADLSGADLSRANLSGANLSGANLSRANLSGADLSGADLSGADLSRVGVKWAQIGFMGHGECGRMLTAIQIKETDEIKFYCGCFTGTVDELRTYIQNGEERLRKTRKLALDTVLILIEAKNDR